MHPKWLDWAQRLQAIAQTGVSYEPHMFDRERYDLVREIAAEMLAAHSELDITIARELMNSDVGHSTPKIDVRGVVFREEESQPALLLVREHLDGGRWTLPGGWADIGESPSETTIREVFEESGYQTSATKLLALYDRRLHEHPPIVFHAYKIFFLCELIEQEELTTRSTSASFLETSEATFFREEAIPANLSVGRVTRAQIARLFEHYRNPDLPTDYD